MVLDKLDGLDDAELHASKLPSGWAPLELLQHLVFVERRWLVWGFLGRQMAEPWGDRRDDRWHVAFVGRNLTNKLTVGSAFRLPFPITDVTRSIQYLEPARSLAIEAGVKF